MKLFHRYPSISAWKIGLLQTALVIGYILTGALVVTSSFAPRLPERIFDFSPALGFLTFLTTFVFSALFCGTSMLGYPMLLCFEKNYRRATQIILWSIGWLALFLLSMSLIAIINLSIQA
ncbi:hypothetical protein COU76_03035 [Candidatus Peregrinibacteria bacterium CG10_big_fil_rev_8_21_14_0_10_49_10]|nr:MAG: hypothetical protein COU76_03035 [Candidatus Peregrinibacteria bacterium CG10_big_fil_rev_8_21_14_0_10_49_10]